MAVHDNVVAPARAVRAETPPAEHWQRWQRQATPAALAHSNVVALNPVPASPPPLLPPMTTDASDLVPPGIDSPYRVLIVEDDRSQALFAQSVLHGAGMQALVHGDAEGVQQAIAEHRPDLILMDIQLPEISGLEVTKWLKEDEDLAHIPVVAVTAFAMKGDEERIREGGCEAYISKPISVMGFLDTVRRYVA